AARRNATAGRGERAAPVLWGPEQAVWVERLRRDFDNLVAAISFLIERAPAQGTALVLNLSTLFQVVGAYSLRRTWLLRALGTEPAPEIRAKLLHGLSNCEL